MHLVMSFAQISATLSRSTRVNLEVHLEESYCQNKIIACSVVQVVTELKFLGIKLQPQRTIVTGENTA